MRKNIFVFCVFFTFAAGAVFAEEEIPVSRPAGSFHRRVLNLNINARVLESEQIVVWDKSQDKTTISGNPVELKLVGSNVVIAAQFTPFVRRHGNVLAAQGQIWVNDPEKGMCYYTSIQTIPMEFGEPIYFYPLGSSEQENASIEIIITVNTDSPESDVSISGGLEETLPETAAEADLNANGEIETAGQSSADSEND